MGADTLYRVMAQSPTISRTQARVAAGGVTLLTLLAVVACMPLGDASAYARGDARLSRVLVTPLGGSVCLVVVRETVCAERAPLPMLDRAADERSAMAAVSITPPPSAGAPVERLNLPPPALG